MHICKSTRLHKISEFEVFWVLAAEVCGDRWRKRKWRHWAREWPSKQWPFTPQWRGWHCTVTSRTKTSIWPLKRFSLLSRSWPSSEGRVTAGSHQTKSWQTKLSSRRVDFEYEHVNIYWNFNCERCSIVDYVVGLNVPRFGTFIAFAVKTFLQCHSVYHLWLWIVWSSGIIVHYARYLLIYSFT